MQRRGRLGQGREIGGLGDGQFVDRLVEIYERSGRDAVGAEAEVDLVQIQFEDLVLRIGPLDPHREQRFLDLACKGDLIGQQEILGDLLGDRGSALRPLVGPVILGIQQGRARHAGIIDAAVLVEILVLRGQERVDDQLRHRLYRQIKPALFRVFAEQRAVGRMDARHHRRLIILKLGIVGQVLGKMPDQSCRRRDADQKQDRSRCKQKTDESQQQAHYRCPFRCRPPAIWRRVRKPCSSVDASVRRSIRRTGTPVVADSANFATPFL